MCNVLALSKHTVYYGNCKKSGMVEAWGSRAAVASGGAGERGLAIVYQRDTKSKGHPCFYQG